VEFKLNATTTAHKVQKRQMLVPSQTQIHKKFIASLLRRRNQEEKEKRRRSRRQRKTNKP
jgi:hypothetical protein